MKKYVTLYLLLLGSCITATAQEYLQVTGTVIDAVNNTLTGVSVRIGSSTTNNGKQMSAVLIDNTGAVVGTGPQTNLTAGSTVVFPFSTPQVVTANHLMGKAIPDKYY